MTRFTQDTLAALRRALAEMEEPGDALEDQRRVARLMNAARHLSDALDMEAKWDAFREAHHKLPPSHPWAAKPPLALVKGGGNDAA